MPHPGRASAYVGAGASLSGASLWHDRIMKRWLGMVALLLSSSGCLGDDAPDDGTALGRCP